MDISDGIAYTRTLKEMEDNFKRLHPDNEENKPIMITFVLSQMNNTIFALIIIISYQ